ncbi:hypothetical protein H4R18_000055 [Coemansia javaensis]|uniref:UBC core domain-containing protein n=1 Tax=Coemansia javaensis TaxID=2761396 RepID=A0A9W8LND6_9FUNG|nr:hypothetical protein H4R18_000055 [Coemansia javaensis]
MSAQDAMLQTPVRNAATRVRDREGGGAQPAGPDTSKSPSQRLKDLFFATYTGGVEPCPSSERSRDAASLTSAMLQTPTKAPRSAAAAAVQSLVEEDGDSMDVDPPAPEQQAPPRMDAHGARVSAEDLKGPAVPLAISTAGRFYSEHMRRCELRIELMGLSTLGHNPRGVYVMPSFGSINVWHGVMFVKRGYWRDAVVRFRIDIPREYPRAHPVITLGTFVAHPLVRVEDGRFALEQQFPQWTPYSDYIYHALHYLKNAFKNRVLRQLQSRDCYNIGAYMAFKNDLPRFREQARVDAMKSRQPQTLYAAQPPDCPIVFTRLPDEQYEWAMRQMKAGADVPGY